MWSRSCQKGESVKLLERQELFSSLAELQQMWHPTPVPVQHWIFGSDRLGPDGRIGILNPTSNSPGIYYSAYKDSDVDNARFMNELTQTRRLHIGLHERSTLNLLEQRDTLAETGLFQRLARCAAKPADPGTTMETGGLEPRCADIAGASAVAIATKVSADSSGRPPLEIGEPLVCTALAIAPGLARTRTSYAAELARRIVSMAMYVDANLDLPPAPGADKALERWTKIYGLSSVSGADRVPWTQEARAQDACDHRRSQDFPARWKAYIDELRKILPAS
jgi:hypothetical protein